MAESKEIKANGKTTRSSSSTRKSKKEASYTNGSSRPSVIPLSYPDKNSLQKAYMPFTKGGGLFFSTSVKYQLKDEIFLIVTLPGADKGLPVAGSVVWITPSGAMDGRKQGVGIEFKGRDGNSLRNRIEGILGVKVTSPTETYTM